ncbi:hypothetical protein GT037_004154 [Alternaria burnsii]|uniref:Uncharacterized protein n=1 Tax=Alternaria burnsii TaxID=1187904 RepID=A0A8H7B6D3_9PLEO|nr:uncharacterized protein GT037_004154 [Alternaria burnsii]KAF7677295.1 hypothetical protein GT037_004154 [Alternaria burnsii]
MSIEIADIHSLGVSADFNESVNSGSPVSITIPEGQSGALGFTATLSCSTGMGHCDSGEMKGEVCWPTMNGDDVAGTYSVIVES